jgi:nucleotide-binding universal stress UspA family protein
MPPIVLVPLDGSDKDARTLAVAVDFAHVADAALHLVRVLDPLAQGAHHAPPVARSAVEQGLHEAAEHVGAHSGRAATWEVLDGVDVAGILLGRAGALNALATVMATQAPRAVDRAIHGSVADRVVREGARPAVLVPPQADYLRGHQLRLRRALVPVDGSDASLSVFAHLLAFPRARELGLVLLQVVLPDVRRVAAERAGRQLETIAERARAAGVATEVRVAEARDPALAIVDAIRHELVDVIAMRTRGAGGVERMVLGSVATTVVRASEVPVFLVPPGASAS